MRRLSTMVPNSAIKRFDYLVKQYGEKHPEIVMETFRALSDTIGIEHPNSYSQSFLLYRRIADDRARGQAGLVHSPVSEDQFRDAARALLKQLQSRLRNDERAQRSRPSDVLWPWVAAQLLRIKKSDDSRGRDLRVQEAAFDLKGRGPALSQWQQAERINLGQYTLEEALEALEDFEIESRDVPQGIVLYRWLDGWTMQELVPSAEPQDGVAHERPERLRWAKAQQLADMLEAEGDVMQHCVAEYVEEVADGQTRIFSLRDPNGRPHVTIEYSPTYKRFVQVMGKQNREPKPEYQARVDEFERLALDDLRPRARLVHEERAAASAYGREVAAQRWARGEEEGLPEAFPAEEPLLSVDELMLYVWDVDAFPEDLDSLLDEGLGFAAAAAREWWEQRWRQVQKAYEDD